MKPVITALVLFMACTLAYAQPSERVIKTCVNALSVSPQVKYKPIPVNEINDVVDEDEHSTETTLKYGKEQIGTWQTRSPDAFGLLYNGKRITLDRVERLSTEQPSSFEPSLAMWGVINEGSTSYVCITFNFEGIGQSGSFQSVRGIYLINRFSRRLQSFYTVGRVTASGVVLAK